MTPDIFVY